MRYHIKCTLLCIAILLSVPVLSRAGITPAYAAGTLTVTNNNDNGPGSLRQAILDAAAGDTIIFDSSLSGATIRLKQTITDALIVDKNLTIDGSALASKITISGDSDNNGVGNVQVFAISATVTLKNLIITKGKFVAGGGGIFNGSTGVLTLVNCVVSYNTSTNDRGGGIISYGSLTVIDSVISNNTTSIETGAGIAAFWGKLNVINSTISDNLAQAESGGGIWIGPGNTDETTITNSIITNNTALGQGGGIYREIGKLTIINSLISNNTSLADKGGGIYGSAIITNSTISSNRTPASSGAGIYTWNSTITNSTISNNIASGSAGGIYVHDTFTMTISGSTFSGNQAGPGGYGGAILNRPGSTTTIVNSTFSENSAGYGGGIWNTAAGTIHLNSVTMSGNQSPNVGGIGGLGNLGTLHFVNTIIANSTNGDCDSLGSATIPLRDNNIVQDGHCYSAAIGDVKLGPLASNGGPTKTHALLAGSPAIDAGNDAHCADTVRAHNVDQRGYFRPADGDAVPGAVCDIGAYEFGASLSINKQPTLDQPANLAILEDASQHTINLTGISAGAGESQALTITATSSDPALIPHPLVSYVSPSATGSLRFTPVGNANGTATIIITVHDDGGTNAGGVDTFMRSIIVQVSAVNDAPSFTIGPIQYVTGGAGPQTVSGWATGFSAGPANEASQSLLGYSIVRNSAPELFSSAPAIDASGTLTYTPTPDARGTATIGVVVRDDSGTTNSGVDISTVYTFTIAIGESYTVYLPDITHAQ